MKELLPVISVAQHIPRINENGDPFTEHQIESLLELSDDEYQNYLNASKILQTFEKDMQLFKIVLWNLQEYFDVLHSYYEVYLKKKAHYPKNRLPMLEVNRCLVNFLTSVTTYLTYTEVILQQKYGETSENFRKFKQYTADEFDNQFSYRFLYHLRNYAQHGGLPITEMSFKTESRKENASQIFSSFDIGISRDKLLQSSFHWKSSLKKELKNGPEIIDVNSHLISFAESLATINSKITKDEFSTLLEPATYIQELIKRTSYDGDDLLLFEYEIKRDVSGQITSVFPSMWHEIKVKLVNTIVEGELNDVTSEFTLYTI